MDNYDPRAEANSISTSLSPLSDAALVRALRTEYRSISGVALLVIRRLPRHPATL